MNALATQPVVSAVQLDLAREVASCYDDPLGFVLMAWPWGKEGTQLARQTGPDQWQIEELLWLGEQVKAHKFDGLHPVMPVKAGYSSGHGTGKSTYAAWISWWIMSTRPHCMGTVTANTFPQLKRKTWAAIRAWGRMCITANWFNIKTDIIEHRSFPDTWQMGAQSCKEENSEAFAGQHAATSTSFYIVDEGSKVPEKIFEVAEGGLTDGEPMLFIFGNCTRSAGKLHRVNFGSERERWHHRTIDARTSKMANKELIAEWIKEHGIDSDFVRVRVLGLPPRASDAQFIDMQRVLDAQKRIVPLPAANEPLIAGVDFAWGGEDSNVVRYRCGLDAKRVPAPLVVPGEETRDDAVMTEKLAHALRSEHNCGGIMRRIAMMFMDSAGIAGRVAANLRKLGFTDRIAEINFGSDSPERRYVYYRDYMWGQTRDWLLKGSIDTSDRLESDLTGPGYGMTTDQRVKLETKESMKKRLVDSPDDGDALALTFAHEVETEDETAKRRAAQAAAARPRSGGSGWS